MYRVELGSDDFDENSDAVKVANVASAIEKLLLANGSTNKFQAERDAWPHIITGVKARKLHPFNPANLELCSPDNCTDGVVRFDELVVWGQWCKRFNFVKQAVPSAKVEAVPVANPSSDVSAANEIKALIAKRQDRLKRAILPTNGGRGRAPRYITPPAQARPPDWNYYRHKPKVEPWEACALALNIEPDSIDYRPESWDGQPETWHGFPSNEIGEHFIKLLRLLNSNQFERQHFTENFAMGVRLSEFSAWCAPVVRDLIGSDIPKELAAMAKDAPQAAPAPDAPAATGGSGDAAAKGEAVPVPNPSGDNDEQRDTTGQNYWRVVLNSNIKKVDEHKKATVRGIIKYLRNLNDARLPNEGGHDELIWIDDMGNRQCVQKKSVSNAVSEARKLS